MNHDVFKSFVEKVAADLNAASRAEISKKNFALTPKQSTTGKPAYPIHDEAHARSALAYVKRFGDAKQQSEVYKDVARKYPHMAAKSSVPALKEKAKTAGLGEKLIGEAAGHKAELAGLGVLAAHPAHALAHEAHQAATGKKVDKGSVARNALEVGGLGVLAAPAAAHLLHKKAPAAASRLLLRK